MADLVPEEGGAVEGEGVDGWCGRVVIGVAVWMRARCDLHVLLVLLEAWVAEEADGALPAVDLLDVGVEDAAFKVFVLLARVDFAEVPEVVEADEFVGCFPHGVDVEPAFSSTAGG